LRTRWSICLLVLFVAGCGRRPVPETSITDFHDGETLLSALRLQSEPVEAYQARLFLVFEGGYLNEDRLRINGEMAAAWPDRLRMIGAYGAFKKVFDLSVEDGDFQIYDNRANVVYVGPADSWSAAADLGLALRPSDLFRVLRIGGEGPLTGALVESVTSGSDSLEITFRPNRDGRRWRAVYETRSLRPSRMWRATAGVTDLVVRYDRYGEVEGRWVPKRVTVVRPLRDERLDIEVRSIRFKEDLPEGAFEYEPPEDAETVMLH